MSRTQPPEGRKDLFKVELSVPHTLPDGTTQNISKRIQYFDKKTFLKLVQSDSFRGFSVNVLFDPTKATEAPKEETTTEPKRRAGRPPKK